MKYKKVLFLAILVYILSAAWLSILRFRAYNAGLVDLGRMEQAVWSILRYGIPVNTFEFGNAPRFIVHCEPVFYLLAPVYFLFQRPEFLLLIQSLALGLAAIPLYHLCLVELKNEKISFFIALSYLMYPSIYYINLLDFHPDSFVLLFIFSAFYFMRKNMWLKFWLMISLVLLLKEYFGIMVAFLGAYFYLEYKDKRRLFILGVLGASYFIFVTFLLPRLFPQYSLWGSMVGPLAGNKYVFNFWDILKNLSALLIPVAFLPLFNPRPLLVILPLLLGMIFLNQFSYANHHIAGVLPFIFIAMVGALKHKRVGSFNAIGFLLFFMVFLANQFYGCGPASIRFYLTKDYHYFNSPHRFKIEKHDIILDKFVKLIPLDKRVSASNHIGSHLARREYINYFPFPEDLSKVDYILVDLKTPNTAPWLSWQEQVERIGRLKNDTAFTLIKDEDDIYLFKRRSIG